MPKAVRWLGAGIVVFLIVVLVARPWLWQVCLKGVKEPLPPAAEAQVEPLAPSTFPGELDSFLTSRDVDLPEVPQDLRKIPERERAKALAAAQVLVRRLPEILEAPPGRWPSSNQPSTLDIFARIRRAARVLNCAGLIWLENGKSPEALRAGFLLIELGQRCAERSNILALLVGLSVSRTGYDLLRTVTCHTSNVEALRSMAERLKRLPASPPPWDDSVRWEYAYVRRMLSNPPGISPLQKALLSYVGVLGSCPISVAAAVFQDALHWDDLSPEALWHHRWGPSGPAVEPKVPGLKLTRADLDRRVQRQALVRSLVPPLKQAFIATQHSDLLRALTLATIAAQAHKVETGTWPEGLEAETLQRVGLSTMDLQDPFTGAGLLWFARKRDLIAAARQLFQQQAPYMPRRRLASLRKLLEEPPDTSPLFPLVWSPLATGDAWAEPHGAPDDFGRTLFRVMPPPVGPLEAEVGSTLRREPTSGGVSHL